MQTVNIHDAKTRFSRLVDAAAAGETVIIAKAGRPVARLTALEPESETPRLVRRGLLRSGYEELSVTSAHTAAVVDLPTLHRDPFDRLLVAQARVEGVTLLTRDEQVSAYGDPVKLAWVRVPRPWGSSR